MSQVQKPQKVCYLANRTITQNEYYGGRKPTHCFVAPDGVTIIPYYEDLFRCSSIVEAVPGETIYTLDEYHQRVIHSETDAQGFLQHSHVFADGGDRSVVTDQTGNVYVANGDISIFDSTSKPIGTIEVPERPISLLISGDKLYITAISSLYQVRLK